MGLDRVIGCRRSGESSRRQGQRRSSDLKGATYLDSWELSEATPRTHNGSSLSKSPTKAAITSSFSCLLMTTPDHRRHTVCIDFIRPLTPDKGFTGAITMSDPPRSDVCLAAIYHNQSAKKFAAMFFEHWYCEKELPEVIISKCDKLFMSKFWCVLYWLIGVKLKMFSAFHPQTDSLSERTNKTINQIICYHVDRSHTG